MGCAGAELSGNKNLVAGMVERYVKKTAREINHILI
jgi:hypothetical protein